MLGGDEAMQERAVKPMLSVLTMLAMLASAITVSAYAAFLQGERAADEIRIGNIMPYTGPMAPFGAIGRAEAAYFDMINDRGGINGRKIRFISYDDNASPRTTIKRTRDLVESDQVLLMFGSFGTPGNLAVREYLNDKMIPQLFVASGDAEWSRPMQFPWTMGWPPSFRLEGRIYANYIQAFYPNRKIAVLWENEQFGRDLLKGLGEGLGDTLGMVVADIAFEWSDTSIDAQLDVLKNSGAQILVFDGAPSFAARAIRKMAELDWHPVILLANASASIAHALRPAGLQNAMGVVSASFLKDPADPVWKDDPAIRTWSAFMDKYYPDGDKEDQYALFGYAAAETLVEVLRQCGDDLSRETIMRKASALRGFQSTVLIPGILINTGPDDFRPIEQLRLVQFDGTMWQPIGDVIESAFVGETKTK
jgi:ABC-type branched-subunit amino acid transport system substrate-binding protein